MMKDMNIMNIKYHNIDLINYDKETQISILNEIFKDNKINIHITNITNIFMDDVFIGFDLEEHTNVHDIFFTKLNKYYQLSIVSTTYIFEKKIFVNLKKYNREYKLKEIGII